MADFSDIESILINVKKGVSGTGALLGHLVDIAGDDTPVMLEPGDLVERESLIQTSIPIGYDLWYLKHTVNMQEAESAEDVFVSQDYLDNQLDFLSDDLGGVKPLKVIANIDDLVYDPNYTDYFGSDVPWSNDGQYFIHQMAFEVWVKGLFETVSSDGAENKYGFDRNNVFGYLSFPVGQLGAMEVISVFRQSSLADFELTDELKPNIDTVSDYFFPPVDDYTGKNICVGDHIVESAYIVPDDARRAVEYPAAPYAEYYKDVQPQMWIRYWIHGDEEKFIPGEFVGIIVKPLALPPHPWWFQETSPLLYSGCWFETGNLTGGVVTAVVLEADRSDAGVGNLYTVKVQGREIEVNSSDFFAYAVDDRVGIIKIESVVETPAVKSFMWADQDRIKSTDTTSEPTEYQILPIEFYV